MSHIAIIVEFDTTPGKFADFEKIITTHAKRCRELEPGCLRFEVQYPIDDSGKVIDNKIVVNELYSDTSAVEFHRNTDRMAKLQEDVKGLVENRHMILAKVSPDTQK
ncbi:MAG TPA: antibiotic biosynthesis monooxygenase [Planktothrix sp.]|jgi:quinol monooxygenase YgiN